MGGVLGVDQAKVQAHSALADLGLCSLMITELGGEVKQHLGVNVSQLYKTLQKYVLRARLFDQRRRRPLSHLHLLGSPPWGKFQRQRDRDEGKIIRWNRSRKYTGF